MARMIVKYKLIYGICLAMLLAVSRAGGEIQVDFSGNDEIRSGRLRSAIPDPPEDSTGKYFAAWAGAAQASIVALYREQGYFDIRIKKSVKTAGKRDTTVLFEVNEARRYRYDTVRVEPVRRDDSVQTPLPDLQAQRAGYYRREDILRDRTAILRALRNAG
ncbi:MAG: hypothetical protein GF350_15660, partial [Chitinivibrionales bacterium]|nr:hypothetical protein [Chitinivibrionales bacterium]